jgi:flavin reductase (DIM6/NTAB) family NADH-FMN oxidoreductase RutF
MAVADMLRGDYLSQTYRKLEDGGLLLASNSKRRGRPNVMTIGWGFIGILWGRPYFVVAVRKSRYTHHCIEATRDYTVNVPGRGMGDILQYCGKVSGRDHDKIKDLNIPVGRPRRVRSPIILGSRIVFECKVKYEADIDRRLLPKDVLSGIYRDRDFHTFYFGEIMACYRPAAP